MIGANIKRIRTKCDMPQSVLAKELNMSIQTISSWEVNRTEPDTETIKKLCNVLNCSLDELFYDSEPMEYTFILSYSDGNKENMQILAYDTMSAWKSVFESKDDIVTKKKELVEISLKLRPQPSS